MTLLLYHQGYVEWSGVRLEVELERDGIYVGDRRGFGLSIVHVGAGTDGWVQRSRGGWNRGVTKVQKVGFMGSFRYVSWGRSDFIRYVIDINRGV